MKENFGEDYLKLAAILTDPEVAAILGIHVDSVELLEKLGHLKSLGGRTKGCQRLYSGNMSGVLNRTCRGRTRPSGLSASTTMTGINKRP